MRTQQSRLGDLLVSAGLITPEQLERALHQQSRTRIPLGKILLQSGAISAVTLYRKLAEQWCVRASALGITFLLSTTVLPNTARAQSQTQTTEIQITLASAVTATPRRTLDMKYPSLFGTTEIRSDNISTFTKWTSMLDRFERQLSATNTATAPRLQSWKAELSRMRHYSTVDKIRAVNDYINQVRYVPDIDNWGKSDHWSTPIEFFSRGGDCEDFAIAKYASLRALGVPSERMRIAVVQDTIKNIPHAILIVYAENGQSFVLDNQDKQLRSINEVTRYRPIFSINKHSWWMHRTQGNS